MVQGHQKKEGYKMENTISTQNWKSLIKPGKLKIEIPKKRRTALKEKYIQIVDASGNNLKNVSCEIPLGTLTCITGVSGSGKSTLTINTLYKSIAQSLNGSRHTVAKHKEIKGLSELDKVIDIDQSPIGRTPRSNPATYTGAFTFIRDWFTGLPESKPEDTSLADFLSMLREDVVKHVKVMAL